MTTLLYDDTTTCKHGHPDARRYVLQTTVRGTKPATVVDCDECDRSRCYTCKKPLPRTATYCRCGGQTWPPRA